MSTPVEIPLWLAILGGTLAVIGVLDRLLIPSFRWYLRKRLFRVIEELNARLELKIQPFKLMRRSVLIDRLMNDPQVMEAVFDHAREGGVPLNIASNRALSYARETVPSFSAFAYFGFGIRVAKWLSKSLYRVRVGKSEDDALSAIDTNATVIFVMNHRSNMDYVLVTYLAATRSALSYAVGEWARVWPLQMLIRSMGAYFIRRRSRNTLYRRVLARYVQMATEGGVTQAVFLEGGLSRDGTLGEPKLGLLSYVVAGFEPGKSRDVVFVPVGLNYDRVLEDRQLVAAAGRKDARFRVGILQGFGFVARHMWLRIRGRFHRYGYACVSFGAPLSLAEFMAGDIGDDPVGALGTTLLTRVGRLIPVLPVSLVASVLLDEGPMTREALARAASQRHEALVAAGIYHHVPRHDEDYALEFGIRMLTERHILMEDQGRLKPVEAERPVLAFYANAIAHYRPLWLAKSQPG